MSEARGAGCLQVGGSIARGLLGGCSGGESRGVCKGEGLPESWGVAVGAVGGVGGVGRERHSYPPSFCSDCNPIDQGGRGGMCVLTSSQQAMMTVPTGSRPRLPARPAIWVYSPLNKFLHAK